MTSITPRTTQPETQPKAAKPARPKLRPLQKECVDKLEKFILALDTLAVYNGSDMGTGKTAETLDLIRRLQKKQFNGKEIRALIVCPKVVKLNWKNEIRMWWPKECGIWVIDSEKDFLEEMQHGFGLTAFNIITYNMLMMPRVLKILKKKRFDFLVLDEAHKVKGLRDKTKMKGTPTMKAAVLDHIWPRAMFKICLSGTPFKSSIMDCYTVFHRILPKEFPDYFTFAKKYCYEEDTPYGVKYYGIRNADKLKKIIRSRFFVRYTKKQMAPELPDKIWTKISLGPEYQVPMTEEEKLAWEQYEEAMDEFHSSLDHMPPRPPKAIATQRRELGLMKVNPSIELVKDFVDNGIPTILFCTHIEVLKKFEKAFKKFQPGIIYGATKDKDRNEAIERFQRGSTDLFIGQIHAAGIGCNLTRAECVVLGENEYDPATVAQGVDRAHRIGQKNSVSVYWLAVEGSVDEKITRNCIAKARNFGKVLNENS